jgi:hypothetical protein
MFGQPYRPDILPDDIHDEEELRRQFGAMHLRLYIHCSQNVRRGFAAAFDDMGVDGAGSGSPSPGDTYLNGKNFRNRKVTLITGDRNELWHPDTINRMYDWLRRELSQEDCRKRIFDGYAHQDLLWGKTASNDVYPTIAAGLGLA